MRLADILDDIDWAVLESSSSVPAETLAGLRDDRFRWAAETDKYVSTVDNLLLHSDLATNIAAALLIVCAPAVSFEAQPDNRPMNQGMEIIIKHMRIRQKVENRMSDTDWLLALNEVRAGMKLDITDSMFLDRINAANQMIESNTETLEQSIIALEHLAGRNEERAGLILMRLALRGKEDLRAEWQEKSFTEELLDITYGMRIGTTLMWIREYFNRELATPDKLG